MRALSLGVTAVGLAAAIAPFARGLATRGVDLSSALSTPALTIPDAGMMEPPVVRAAPNATPPIAPPPLLGLDLTRIAIDDDGASAHAADKRRARLTLDPDLQRAAEALLAAHRLPEAAIVMIDPANGELLAYASHLESGPRRDLCVEASAPAASVFKVITGSALVESAGLSAETRQCYAGGGEQRIVPSDLDEDPARDRTCVTLGGAMGRSLNVVFARLAQRHLDAKKLEATASKFGFGEPIPFDVPVEPSTLSVPSDALGFARTAAGFWNSTLSPLEAAWMSATIARGGEPPRLSIVRDVIEPNGALVWSAPPPSTLRRAVSSETAQAVTAMMEHTVREGTSFRAFHDATGAAFLPGITVAGKTGTLTAPDGQRLFTWFTAFAPSRPMPGVRAVAIAVLVVNHPAWHVKANVVAREMLRTWFAAQNVARVTRPPVASTARLARR